MQEEPERHWMAKDFQNHPRFIGYEAGPRLCDLCDAGLAVRVGKQGRFMLFALTAAGRTYLSITEARKEQTPTQSEETPRQTDDFPDEVQESPAMETVQDMIDARIVTPLRNRIQEMKKTVYVPHKDGFIDGRHSES